MRPGSSITEGLPAGLAGRRQVRASAAGRQLRKPAHGHRGGRVVERLLRGQLTEHRQREAQRRIVAVDPAAHLAVGTGALRRQRSEEHTSELQSLMRISYAVFCLKKKKQRPNLT